MRSARSLICFSDSSPDIYSTSCPSSASFWHTCKRRVDLPMPGSPPTSTREPGTIPPPKTRSSSCIRVVTRSSSFVSIEERQTGPPAALLSCAFATLFFSTVSSTKVFHSRHPGHWPIHLGDSYPQLWQKNTVEVFPFAMFTPESCSYAFLISTVTAALPPSSTLKTSLPPRPVVMAPALTPSTTVRYSVSSSIPRVICASSGPST